MNRKWTLPLLALGLTVWSVWNVFGVAQDGKRRKESPALPHSANVEGVSGAGLVEPRTVSSGTATVPVGTDVAGVVSDVYVTKPGQVVKAGEPLFRLDDRVKRAELGLKKAALELAKKQLVKLELSPRPEEIRPLESKVRADSATLDAAQDAYMRALRAGSAVAPVERIKLREDAEHAKQVVAQDQKSLDLLKAGTWKPDLEIARAVVAQAEASVKQVESDLEQLLVVAPIAGTVLQVNVRKGQAVGQQPGVALMLMGDLSKLHVRVSIDENDISRFKSGTEATATTRGLPQHKLKLKFVRIEPYVVPKKSLTGDNAERVDTRVMEAIYEIEDANPPVQLGQQLDVFIATGPKKSK